MKDEFIDTIKSRGYWRINFQPIGKPADFSLKECEELVDKNSVKLRGWYYPFYGHGDADNHGIENHNNYVQGWIDSGEFKEFWRMYKSSQFLHYSAVQEDWSTPEVEGRFSPNDLEPGKYLNFVGSLTYYITEIVEFLARLHHSGLYAEGAYVSISLNNTKGRQLSSFDAFRRLSFPRVTQENPITFEKAFSPDDLQLPAKDLAIEPIVHFFEMFNMADISIDQVIKKDQETLYGYKNKWN
jgi:hypothetical protein